MPHFTPSEILDAIEDYLYQYRDLINVPIDSDQAETIRKMFRTLNFLRTFPTEETNSDQYIVP